MSRKRLAQPLRELSAVGGRVKHAYSTAHNETYPNNLRRKPSLPRTTAATRVRL